MIEKRYKISELPETLTLKETASVLRVSPLTLKRWGKKGILPPLRINERGDRRYLKAEVLKYLGVTPKLESQL